MPIRKPNNIFPEKAKNLASRVYDNLHCSRCGSIRVVKHSRECGRIQGCGRTDCNGCHEWEANNQVRQSFLCQQCGNTWTVISML